MNRGSHPPALLFNLFIWSMCVAPFTLLGALVFGTNAQGQVSMPVAVVALAGGTVLFVVLRAVVGGDRR